MNRVKALRLFALLQAVIVAFWWLLSHWLYSDWYHGVMGFAPGSYDDDFVKIIGVMALMPLVGLIEAARRPDTAAPFLRAYITWCFGMAATYAYTINFGDVPEREYLNAALLVVSGLALLYLFPRRERES